MGRHGSATVRRLAFILAWTTATVLAAGVAWTAVSRLGGEGAATGARPLTPSAVRRQLAEPVPGRTAARPTVRALPDAARSPAPARKRSRSWQVLGGSVGAVCRGAVVDLLYAAPADGWSYRLDRKTPGVVSVLFFRARHSSELVARCVGGAPARVVSMAPEEGSAGDGESGD